MKHGTQVRLTTNFIVGWWVDERLGVVPKGATGTLIERNGQWWVRLHEAWPGHDAETWMNEEWPKFGIEVENEDLGVLLEAI